MYTGCSLSKGSSFLRNKPRIKVNSLSNRLDMLGESAESRDESLRNDDVYLRSSFIYTFILVLQARRIITFDYAT